MIKYNSSQFICKTVQTDGKQKRQKTPAVLMKLGHHIPPQQADWCCGDGDVHFASVLIVVVLVDSTVSLLHLC